MPKIFEYFGFVFFFYSNEHEPIHVHVIHGDRQLVYEIILEDGNFKALVRRNAKGYLPLSQHDAGIVYEETGALHANQEKIMTIVDAVYTGGLSLSLTFSDGIVRVVDFERFIKKYPHPQYDRYLDPDCFQTFSIENGNVVWGKDWDMMFPIEDLYNGHLD